MSHHQLGSSSFFLITLFMSLACAHICNFAAFSCISCSYFLLFMLTLSAPHSLSPALSIFTPHGLTTHNGGLMVHMFSVTVAALCYFYFDLPISFSIFNTSLTLGILPVLPMASSGLLFSATKLWKRTVQYLHGSLSFYYCLGICSNLITL